MIFFAVFVVVIVIMGAAALFVDKSNFPQRKFRPKIVKGNTTEDRVGAHIVSTETEDR